MTRSADAMRALRRRLTIVATVVVALVLVATAVMLLVLQRRVQFAEVDDRLGERADALEAMVADEFASTFPALDAEDRAAQLVTVEGEVLTSTANLNGLDPIAEAPAGDEVFRTLDELPIDDDEFRVLSRRVLAGGSAAVLHVAENVDDIDEGVAILTRLLLFAFPALLLLLAGLTWWLVGRTLRPVALAAERQDRFVSDSAHELRSPLARMRARLEVDLAHPTTADATETATATLDDVRGMQRLVDDLLLIARSGSGGTAGWTVVDLGGLVARDAQGIDTSCVGAGPVRGDPEELARVVRNLLDNATRHAASRVSIAVATEGDSVVLTVDDDGSGIPVDQREKVFERFTRLDDARTPGEGRAGLGLSIAREVVVRHGGSITVGDSPSGGARFTVTLARARSAGGEQLAADGDELR